MHVVVLCTSHHQWPSRLPSTSMGVSSRMEEKKLFGGGKGRTDGGIARGVHPTHECERGSATCARACVQDPLRDAKPSNVRIRCEVQPRATGNPRRIEVEQGKLSLPRPWRCCTRCSCSLEKMIRLIQPHCREEKAPSFVCTEEQILRPEVYNQGPPVVGKSERRDQQTKGTCKSFPTLVFPCWPKSRCLEVGMEVQSRAKVQQT